MATTIKIGYSDPLLDPVVEATFTDPAEAVRWLIANLAGWCIDDDIEIQVDGIIYWPQ